MGGHGRGVFFCVYLCPHPPLLLSFINTPSTLATPLSRRHLAMGSSRCKGSIVSGMVWQREAAGGRWRRCAGLGRCGACGGGDGAAPRGQIVGRVERERCVEGRRLRTMSDSRGGWRKGKRRRRRNNYFTWCWAEYYVVPCDILLPPRIPSPYSTLTQPLFSPY